MNSVPPPWYRQPWPWFLIALPAVTVCGSFCMLWLALSEPEAVVRDEYDRNGLEVTRRLDQDARARALGVEASLRVTSAGTAVIELLPVSLAPATLSLTLIHPTAQKQDETLVLRRGPDGLYTAGLPRPEGKRYLRLEAGGGASEWRLRGVLAPTGEADARLVPGDA